MGKQTYFKRPQIANPHILGPILISQIRKFLRCANPQIENLQIFMISPQIVNPQISKTYCPTLSQNTPESRRFDPMAHATTQGNTVLTCVSPASGYVSLALVKYSNEGGPGPRYNMKEDPGSSTLIMLVVHAYHPYLMPLLSEAGDKETSSVGLPPAQSNLGKAPSRPLEVHTPPLAKMPVETRLGGNHTSASDSRSEAIDWARGGCGDHFGLFRAPVRGRATSLKCASKAL